MSEKGSGKSRGQRPASTPEDIPVAGWSPTLPSGDYSYTVELVGTIQNELGRLTEAVQSLKEQSKEQSVELKAISKDVHAAKVVMGVVGSLLLLVFASIAWMVNTYISTHPPK